MKPTDKYPSELIVPTGLTQSSSAHGLGGRCAGLDLSTMLADGASPVTIPIPDENNLLSGLEARLAKEVERLISALNQFGGSAQAIHEKLPTTAQFGKLVTLLLGSFSFQMAQALGKDSHLPLLSDDGALRLHQLGLSRDEFFRELEIDGRRFLAIALIEDGGTQVFEDRDAAARTGDQ